MTVTVTTKAGERVAFLVEAKQAWHLEIRNVPGEQMPLLLNVVCPNIIYHPYLWSNVADIVQQFRAFRRSIWRRSTSRRCTSSGCSRSSRSSRASTPGNSH